MQILKSISPAAVLAQECAVREFGMIFPGSDAHWVAQAPGRVNLIGEHVDYNGGIVLPAAIDFYTTLVAAPHDRPEWIVRTAFAPEEAVCIPVQSPVSKSGPYWTSYLRGVMNYFLEAGWEVPGMRISIQSNVPTGAGLSSSAALEVGVACLIEAASGRSMELKKKALLCQKAENVYAEAPCGFMDQFASAMGRKDHFLKIDCRDQTVEPIPMVDPQWELWIVHSGASHSIATSEYGKRRADCEAACEILGIQSLREIEPHKLSETLRNPGISERVSRRVKHVVTEIERANAASEALRHSEWETLGTLMHASHQSMRDDYEITCDEVDRMVEQIETLPGALGVRMTGGGFGGCVIAVMQADLLEAARVKLAEWFESRYSKPLQSWTTRPVEGAWGRP